MSSRKIRGLTQKLYVINYTTNGEKIDVDIMGTTGNMYNLVITNEPSCNCPDYLTRGKRCKHIYYFLVKALGLKDGEEDEDYTDKEVKKMCDKVNHIKNTLFVNDPTRKKFIKNKKNLTGTNKSGNVKHKSLDDLCPICLCDLEGEEVSYCEFSCGKAIHTECINKYFDKVKIKNCILCNMPWNINNITLPTYVNIND